MSKVTTAAIDISKLLRELSQLGTTALTPENRKTTDDAILVIKEMEPYELMADQLTEAMQKWGWQHCADGPDLIEQIEKVIAQAEVMDIPYFLRAEGAVEEDVKREFKKKDQFIETLKQCNDDLFAGYRQHAIDFFQWWWNKPGTNTEQGYAEWVDEIPPLKPHEIVDQAERVEFLLDQCQKVNDTNHDLREQNKQLMNDLAQINMSLGQATQDQVDRLIDHCAHLGAAYMNPEENSDLANESWRGLPENLQEAINKRTQELDLEEI